MKLYATDKPLYDSHYCLLSSHSSRCHVMASATTREEAVTARLEEAKKLRDALNVWIEEQETSK